MRSRHAALVLGLLLAPSVAFAELRLGVFGGGLTAISLFGPSELAPSAGVEASYALARAELPVALRLRGQVVAWDRTTPAGGLDLSGVWRSSGEDRPFVGGAVGVGLWEACSDGSWCSFAALAGVQGGYPLRLTRGLVLAVGAQVEAHALLTGAEGLLVSSSAFVDLRFE